MGVDLRKKLNLMKSLITIFVLLTAILFIPSCSSDPCEEISCLNGGICTEGTCDCPPGWSGDDCSVVDFDFVGKAFDTRMCLRYVQSISLLANCA